MKKILISVILALLAGCGSSGSNENTFVGTPAQQAAPETTVALRLLLDIGPTNRIPEEATSFRVEVYDRSGRLLQTTSVGRVAEVILQDLPAGFLFVRLVGSSPGGVLGYCDRSLNASAGETTLNFDVLLAGDPPPPSFEPPAVGQASFLAFLVHPRSTTVGATQTVEVLVLDNSGARVTGFQGDASLSLAAGGPVPMGSVTASFVNGVAVFGNLSFQTEGNAIRLQASASGLTAAESLPFDVVQAAVPTPAPPVAPSASSLAFVSQPTQATQLQPFSPIVQVEVRDQFGERFAASPVTVTLSLDITSSPSGILRGPLTQTTVDGVATFIGVDYTQLGTIAVVASAEGLAAATSAPIEVLMAAIPPAPSRTKILVSDRNNQRLVEMDDFPNNSGTALALGAVHPWGVALDDAGRYFVSTSTAPAKIRRFDDISGAAELDLGIALNQVQGLVFYQDTSVPEPNRFLLAANFGSGQVFRLTFNSMGQLLGGMETLNVTQPINMAIDSARRIYVTSFSSGQVIRYDDMAGNNPMTFTGFMRPYDVEVDSSGQIYVTNSGYMQTVIRMDADGNNRVSCSGPAGDGFDTPTGLALGSDGRVYVADSAKNRVVSFIFDASDPTGGSDYQLSTFPLNNPSDIVVVP